MDAQFWRASIVLVLAVLGFSDLAFGDFNGSLYLVPPDAGTPVGLQGTGAWGNINSTPPAELSWAISQTGAIWHYSYVLNAAAGAISHFIVEVSPNFTPADVFNEQGGGSAMLGDYNINNGNPGMPAAIHGLKFENFPENSNHVYTFSFDSSRGPTWGDFYAKDGTAGGQGPNAIWNLGITAADPVAALANGSYMNKLLVPDTSTFTTGKVQVIKFEDTDRDGLKDLDEQILGAGWEYQFSGSANTYITGTNGMTAEIEINPGTYTLTELSTRPTGFDGWWQTTNNGNPITVTITEGINDPVYVGNIPEPCTLMLLGAGLLVSAVRHRRARMA